jgi:hypothetical protein
MWLALLLMIPAASPDFAGARSTAESIDDGVRQISVELDHTITVDVGYAVGFRCDDISIVEPSMKPKNEQANLFVVKGLKEGATLCRVGTQPGRPTMLLQVKVVPAKRR